MRMQQEIDEIFDVAVMGGGPSGMMAAGRAAELGKNTILLEKNRTLGRKLLLTGKGRSNIAKAEFNSKELVKKYGREGDFLLHALSIFGPKETVDFFENRGLKMKVERGKRIFPETDSAKDVLDILAGYLERNKIEIKTDAEVREIMADKNKISRIVLKNGQTLSAKNYILTTGGKAFPGTGSTGDGYKWAEKLGHRIIKLRPALVPVRIKEGWVKSLQGLSLKNVELSVFQDGKKKDSRFGELLFTHFGLSGPMVLDLSGRIGELLDPSIDSGQGGEVKLFLDLKPALTEEALDKRIQSDFVKYSNKLLKNALDDLLPQKLIPIIIELSSIESSKKVNLISRGERKKLVKLLKNLTMTVSSLLGFEFAIVTSGGIPLKEIDAKTMRSKIIDNLFFAGEIINLHGPTGGYNLQVCWSTGYLAGQSAASL